MPLWLPIWTLSTLALDCLGVLAITFYLPATATDPPTKVTDSRVTFFILTLATWTGPGVVYACSVILSFLVHSRRLQFHNLLLERMASFDFRNAKCKLESDRQGRVEGKRSMRNRSLPINLVQSSRPPKPTSWYSHVCPYDPLGSHIWAKPSLNGTTKQCHFCQNVAIAFPYND